jgi:hypothetical protein
MDHGAMGSMPASDPAAARLKGWVGVDNVAVMPRDRLSEADDGLDGNGRCVLRLSDLRNAKRGNDPRPPTRDVALHLTGNMERFM